MGWQIQNPPRNGEVADAKRLTEGAQRALGRWRRAPSTTSLRLAVPLPVPGRIEI